LPGAAIIAASVVWIVWDYPQWLSSVQDVAERPDAPRYISSLYTLHKWVASMTPEVVGVYAPWLVTGLAVLFIGSLIPWEKWWHRSQIGVSLLPGTARLGNFGLITMPTVDLQITNEGPSINLITKAKFTNVATGFIWEKEDAWEYIPRRLASGPNVTSGFHVATIQPNDDVPNQWIVAVRTEHMTVVRQWVISTKSFLWFDIQFDFYHQVETSVRHIRSVGVHASASDDRKRFVMNLKL
jgi:hypothetical protein